MNCKHIDNDNKQDCVDDAGVMCQCCGVPVCHEHGQGKCRFGGMSFIELNH